MPSLDCHHFVSEAGIRLDQVAVQLVDAVDALCVDVSTVLRGYLTLVEVSQLLPLMSVLGRSAVVSSMSHDTTSGARTWKVTVQPLDRAHAN